MSLSFDDQISYANAILVHWRTHFPGKEVSEMNDTELEADITTGDQDLTDWKTKAQVAARAEGPRDASQLNLEVKCQAYRDGITGLIGRGDSPARRALPSEEDYQTRHAQDQSGGGTATVPTNL